MLSLSQRKKVATNKTNTKKKDDMLASIHTISVSSSSFIVFSSLPFWKMCYQQESSHVAVCCALIIGNHYHLVPIAVSHYWHVGKWPHQTGRLPLAFSCNFYVKVIASSKNSMSYKATASIKLLHTPRVTSRSSSNNYSTPFGQQWKSLLP